MDRDDQVAEIEERVRKLELSFRRRNRLNRLWRRIGPATRVLVAVLLAGAGVLVVRHLISGGEQPAANAVATSGATASTTPGVSGTTTAHAASSEPFAGTPAANYPKGAAGITLPPAKAVPGFSVKQVAADLAKVRTALIASRLDPRMTDRHDPSRFVKLLAPTSQAFAEKQFQTAHGLSLVTWIDPRTPLNPAEQPRVRGRISYVSTATGHWSTARRPIVACSRRLRWTAAPRRIRATPKTRSSFSTPITASTSATTAERP